MLDQNARAMLSLESRDKRMLQSTSSGIARPRLRQPPKFDLACSLARRGPVPKLRDPLCRRRLDPTSTQAGARQSVLRHHWPLRALPSHASRCDRFSELRLRVKERRFPTVPMFRVLFRTLQAPGRSDDANGSTEMNSSFEGRSYAILSFSSGWDL